MKNPEGRDPEAQKNIDRFIREGKPFNKSLTKKYEHMIYISSGCEKWINLGEPCMMLNDDACECWRLGRMRINIKQEYGYYVE